MPVAASQPPARKGASQNSSSVRFPCRRIQIERHEFQQFLILHLGQRHVGRGAEQIPGKLLLRLDQLIDLVLYGAPANEFMHKDILGLSDSESSISRLIFDGRVPPPVEMNDMRGSGEIKPCSARLE